MIRQKEFVRIVNELDRLCQKYFNTDLGLESDLGFQEILLSYIGSIDMAIDPKSDVMYWYCIDNDFGRNGLKYNDKVVDTPIKLYNAMKKAEVADGEDL